MAQRSRLIVPALGGLYAALGDIALTLLRLVTGLWLVPHGWYKLDGNMAAAAQYFSGLGFTPGLLWAWMVALTEFGGGLCLASGFLTRLAAIPIIVFMLTATVHHSVNGFMWNDGGFEYPLFWAVSALVFLVRGGGRYSLDRLIGREF